MDLVFAPDHLRCLFAWSWIRRSELDGGLQRGHLQRRSLLEDPIS